jgi:8-hydroxy-5-deazaflavin:NADPH oxidoreductase
MKIGIIGSGNIGGTTARLFANAGHQVAITNSRGPASLTGFVQGLGPNVRATTVEEAEAFSDVVLVAIPLGKYQALPAAPLSGKIVIDAMNYYPGRDGEMDFGGQTSTEFIASYLPGARVVKAFNTMVSATLSNGGKPGAPMDERLALYLAGDDPEAKAVVSRLIDEIGFAPIDTGSLNEGGWQQQPGSAIYARALTAREARNTLASMPRKKAA